MVAHPLVNGLLLLVVGGSNMNTRCIDSDQHPNLKSD